MGAEEYLHTNYYLTGGQGPDYELWASSGGYVTQASEPNLNGYFPRLKKINEAIIPINKEIIGLNSDLVQRRAELEVAKAEKEAALSGIETTREDFLALTGVYPEEAQLNDIKSIALQ
jgi:hypothetical protein